MCILSAYLRWAFVILQRADMKVGGGWNILTEMFGKIPPLYVTVTFYQVTSSNSVTTKDEMCLRPTRIGHKFMQESEWWSRIDFDHTIKCTYLAVLRKVAEFKVLLKFTFVCTLSRYFCEVVHGSVCAITSQWYLYLYFSLKFFLVFHRFAHLLLFYLMHCLSTYLTDLLYILPMWYDYYLQP